MFPYNCVCIRRHTSVQQHIPPKGRLTHLEVSQWSMKNEGLNSSFHLNSSLSLSLKTKTNELHLQQSACKKSTYSQLQATVAVREGACVVVRLRSLTKIMFLAMYQSIYKRPVSFSMSSQQSLTTEDEELKISKGKDNKNNKTQSFIYSS